MVQMGMGHQQIVYFLGIEAKRLMQLKRLQVKRLQDLQN
jgi:hypothetical protein